MKILDADLLGSLIWAKRKQKMLTQVQMGKILGVSFRTIYNREKSPKDWTIEEFKRLAIALEEDPVELVRMATKEI